MLRAVLDTTVFVAAALSKKPETSPTRELLERWMNGEFVLLVSPVLLEEIVEQLTKRRTDPREIEGLLAEIERLAELVDVRPEQVQPETVDPDDDHVLACAVAGGADYLVTYDPDIAALGEEYRGIKIRDGLHFLYAVRGDKPP